MLYSRLLRHLAQKDFWKEVTLFISTDENLKKVHVKYLENSFYTLAKAVDWYELPNSCLPNKPKVSEADIAELEEFIDQAKVLVIALGHKIFENLRNSSSVPSQTDQLFYIKAASGANAQGKPTNEGFLILQGPWFALTPSPSFSPPQKKKLGAIA